MTSSPVRPGAANPEPPANPERRADPLSVWIPHAQGVPWLDGLPIRLTVFDGTGDPPEALDSVEFCVPGRPSPRMLAAISGMSGLKVLQTLATGVDGFLRTLPEGVVLCNGRGIQTGAVAEWVVAAILTMQRELLQEPTGPTGAGGPTETGRPTGAGGRRASRTLDGACVVIVGYGEIGAAVERRLSPFGCRIERVARSAREGVRAVGELPELLRKADVVVSLLPRTAETRGLFGTEEFARMRDGTLFVNAGRGDAADTEALVKEVGRLRAALDVTDPEPLPQDHPLRHAPGVLVTPHVAGQTTAFLPTAYTLVREQIERYLDGLPLRNVVEKDY